MIKYFFTLGLSMCLLMPALADSTNSEQTDDNTTSRFVKVETIRIEDKQGRLEEERVAAMRSEIRYVPTGSTNGYNLIVSQESQGKSQSAHQGQNMLIPSWQVFAW